MVDAGASVTVDFTPWSPLGQGFLTGAVAKDQSFVSNDIRSRFPRFTQEALEANQPVVDLVKEIADRGAPPRGQVALGDVGVGIDLWTGADTPFRH